MVSRMPSKWVRSMPWEAWTPGPMRAAFMSPPAFQAPATSEDAIEAIQKFKRLYEEGVITEEEFAAKKRQLLGI